MFVDYIGSICVNTGSLILLRGRRILHRDDATVVIPVTQWLILVNVFNHEKERREKKRGDEEGEGKSIKHLLLSRKGLDKNNSINNNRINNSNITTDMYENNKSR